MIVCEVRVHVEGLMFGVLVLQLGEDDGEQGGCIAGWGGRVFSEDCGIMGYAGADNS